MNRYERERPATGGVRAAVNGYLNRKFWDDPRCVEDTKGWVQPFANWQGWEEFNAAVYALRCVMIWRAIQKKLGGPGVDPWYHSGLARIESDLRTFHFALARSRKCDRPALP